MTKRKNPDKTAGYNDPVHYTPHSVGNLVGIKLQEGSFVKDPAKLLYQYNNLIKKLGKRFAKDFRTWDQYEDLYAYIKDAFVELAMEYNPFSGVDFPGYIVRKLPLRIKYSYVSKRFLSHKRMVLLRSGDYTIRDLLNMIQDHGEGQITTDKNNRVADIQKVSHMDFSFAERLQDMESHIKMDSLDRLIFLILIRGFSQNSHIVKLAAILAKHCKLHYSKESILRHIKSLKSRLRKYYLTAPDSPIQRRKGSTLNYK